MSRKQDFFAQDSKICFGIDMFRMVNSARYGRCIRRYAWNEDKQMHVPAEYIPPAKNIMCQLIDLRIKALEKQNGI
nr:MAG TPA: hypothetical protein [Caudoviricetes sp.]